MKIHILIDDPQYKRTAIVGVYADRGMAERKQSRLETARRRWLERQRKLEEEDSDESWMSQSPNDYDDLSIQSYTVH